MTKEDINSIKPITKTVRRPPVRVKLRRIHANLAKACPPDGLQKEWWARLKKALGTESSAFVLASLYELQRAAQLPGTGISEAAVNAALAMIEAAAPKDEIAGALAVQMACCHTAAMAILTRFGGGNGTERKVVTMAAAASRLFRAYAIQVDTLRRLQRGSDQTIRIERVDIHEGVQAVVGLIAPKTETGQ